MHTYNKSVLSTKIIRTNKMKNVRIEKKKISDKQNNWALNKKHKITIIFSCYLLYFLFVYPWIHRIAFVGFSGGGMAEGRDETKSLKHVDRILNHQWTTISMEVFHVWYMRKNNSMFWTKTPSRSRPEWLRITRAARLVGVVHTSQSLSI